MAKISAIGYSYKQPFTKDQVPGKVGKGGFLFHEVEIDPLCIGEYMRNNIVWSPFIFEDGIRRSENNKGITNFWVFDYDEGVLKYDEIFELMIKTEYFNFLRNHKVFFVGSPRNTIDIHKYRIIIPFEEELKLNENYSLIYQKMLDAFNEVGLKMDTNTKDLARLWYSVDFCEVHSIGDKILKDFGIIYRHINRVVEEEKKERALSSVVSGYYGRNRSRKHGGQIEPKHLVNKPLYQRYRSEITATTAHKGVTQLVGYLKKCGCLDSDIKEHIWECMVESGGLRTRDQYEREIKGIL